ncbi:MAG: peptidylprolyl isomerase [Acidobacteriia bacterium]|nr:peptidylprolyl isomerase [Terriglobia bacterium]
MKKSVVLLAGIGLLCAAAFAADSVIEEIVVRVNNGIITRSELIKSLEDTKREVAEKVGAGPTADQELAKRTKDLLRDMIDQQLLVQKAQDLGITGDTELIKRLDEIRKSMNLDSMEALEKAAQAQGVSYEDFKQNLKNQIVTQQVIQREVGSHVQVTPDEIKAFYQEHQQEFTRPETVRLSEILVSTQQPSVDKNNPAQPDTQALEAAQKKAEAALAAIKSGEHFEDAAKKYSEGPSAQQGGDLGEFKRGTMAKELEDRTFAMKPGDVTDVIRTKQGFVILKVTEHSAAGVPPLKTVEPNIQEAIYYQKLQPALRDYLTKLREQAYIDIKPGFVDSGASPNQTKPILTTAEEHLAKTKKKKRFVLF